MYARRRIPSLSLFHFEDSIAGGRIRTSTYQLSVAECSTHLSYTCIYCPARIAREPRGIVADGDSRSCFLRAAAYCSSKEATVQIAPSRSGSLIPRLPKSLPLEGKVSAKPTDEVPSEARRYDLPVRRRPKPAALLLFCQCTCRGTRGFGVPTITRQ